MLSCLHSSCLHAEGHHLGTLCQRSRHRGGNQPIKAQQQVPTQRCFLCPAGQQFADGIMPHGGEGMIFSRAGLRRMMSIIDWCIEEVVEATYSYGDVQTAICARLAGVPFNETGIPTSESLQEALAPPQGLWAP